MAWGSPSSQSDWFDSVTGTNDYERQSWRDNFNGGMAAGDFTGNTNVRLEAERAAFQGATWSGSSSQPSALQLAQSYAAVTGPGAGAATSRGGASYAGSGPGAAGAVANAPQAQEKPGKPGNGFGGFGGAPLTVKVKDSATGVKLGGDWFEPNPWFSNTDQWEERWGEPGDWLGGVVTMIVDGVYTIDRVRRAGPDAVGGSIDNAIEAYQNWPVATPEDVFTPFSPADYFAR